MDQRRQGVVMGVTHSLELSNSRSNMGSGSKVVISHVVVGPDASSALPPVQNCNDCK